MEKRQLKNPFSQMVITTLCSQKCKGCDVWKNQYYPPMPLDLAIRAVDDLAYAGIKILEFIGGEPFDYPHMLPLIRHICYEQLEIERCGILTNAMNWDALQKIKPYLSKRIGIVVSINYTREQCEHLIAQGIDMAMAKKSLAGWRVLDEFVGICWIRVALVINTLNIEIFPEIGKQVIEKGALFSVCPLVYKRQISNSPVITDFRSKEVGLAPIAEHKELMRKAVNKLIKLKNQYPEQVVPSLEYIQFLPETCKNPADPYTISCAGLGLPYIRVSHIVGKSKIDGTSAPRLRACTDIMGEKISEIVTSDLKYPSVIESLADIYQLDTLSCQIDEKCCWSVTFALRNQKV